LNWSITIVLIIEKLYITYIARYEGQIACDLKEGNTVCAEVHTQESSIKKREKEAEQASLP
jgi:hypothetical protein